MALSDFPRYPLTFGPSPVHPLERLTRHLGGAQIWAKREDCNSGLAYGGNKTRKLEYIVPDNTVQMKATSSPLPSFTPSVYVNRDAFGEQRPLHSPSPRSKD